MPADDEPKLIEQLTALREEWGEGFDEDIATPLARIVKRLREQHDAATVATEQKLDQVREQRDEAQGQLEDLRETQPVFEDLEDLRRGVLTQEELFERHLDFTPVSV